MPRLFWDTIGKRYYETGVRRGVLWVMNRYKEGSNIATYNTGVAWNGLTAITETPSGAEETALYADDIKYLSLRSTEEFGCTIEAYTYPNEFMLCDGTIEASDGTVIGQQKRLTFAFSYVTTVGNDTDGNDYGYKLHIIYGCTASPSERAYSSINDSPEAITFSWEVSTIPVDVPGFKPTSIITIDSTKLTEDTKVGFQSIQDILYGSFDNQGALHAAAKKSDGTHYTVPEILGYEWFITENHVSQLLMPEHIIRIMDPHAEPLPNPLKLNQNGIN